MCDTIALLRRDIEHDLEVVAKNLELKYEADVPFFVKSNNDVFAKLEELSKKVGDKLATVDKCLDDSDVTELAHSTKTLKLEWTEVKESRDAIDKLCLIETNLTTLYSHNGDVVKEAELIRECLDLLDDITKDWESTVLIERIRAMLTQEVNDMANLMRYSLSEFFNNFVSFPESKTNGLFIMNISNEKPRQTSENLRAMHLLNHWDSRFTKWTSNILQHFCQTIIDSRDGQAVIDCDLIKCGVRAFNARGKGKAVGDMSVQGVLDALGLFFAELAGSLEGIDLAGEKLARHVGRAVEVPLMTMIVKEGISLAVPFCDQKDPRFDEALELAEKFRAHMIDLSFWNESVPPFSRFAESHERVFIDRRCLAVLSATKKIICEPFLELIEVGNGDEMDEETIADFAAAFQAPPPNLRNCDQTYPKLLQLLRCKVSKSVVEFVELLEKTLCGAVEADTEMVCGRLALTANNMLGLYMIIAPKHHNTTITSVPQAAAVFFNNAYYICHRVLMLPFGVLKSVKDSTKNNHFRPLFVENVWKLREMAAQYMEQMLAQCRRNISTTLVDRQLFTNLNDYNQLKVCEKTVKACVMSVESLAEVWREVLSEAVFCKALANVTSFLLSDLCSQFLSAEDIRVADAEAASPILDTLLAQLEKLFVVRGASCIHSVCDSAYFRCKEIIFCLNGSLKSIDDRWCDGKGPLAQWLSPGEVRSLVRALFMNTEQRKMLLESIC